MGVHLIVDYYEDSRPERREELLLCLRRNLAHPAIEAVHNLGRMEAAPPEDIRLHPRYHAHPVGRRLTFQDALAFAAQELDGKFVGICNLDIYLDDRESNWAAAEPLVRNDGLVLCQSRFELGADGRLFRDPTYAESCFANTQDAWFFVAPLELPDAEFPVGLLGSDNAIAERIQRSGRIPVNLASRFRVIHVDRCRNKHGGNAVAVHTSEATAAGTAPGERPQGAWLLPDFDLPLSLDALVDRFNLSPTAKYRLICETLSRMLVVKN